VVPDTLWLAELQLPQVPWLHCTPCFVFEGPYTSIVIPSAVCL